MDKDIIICIPKIPLKTKGQIMLELADKAGKSYIGFMLLQRGDITIIDYLKWETSRN